MRHICFAFIGLFTCAILAGCGEVNQAEFQEFTAMADDGPEALADVKDPATDPATSENDPANKGSNNATNTAATGESNNTDDTTDQKPVKSASSNPAAGSSVTDVSAKNSGPSNKTKTPTDVTANPSTTATKTTGSDKKSVTGKKEDKPRKVEVLVKERKFKAEGPEGALRANYDDIDLLKVLNMEPVTPNAVKLMPDWLKSLNGKRIRIRGFMYPPFEETGIKVFVLARDNQICCFGRNPKIYDLVEINMREGKSASYIQNRPFDVVGVFHISPAVDEGELYQLYRIDDAVVIDK